MKLYTYKLFLILVKWIPVVIAAGILLTNTLAVCNIDLKYLYVLNILFGNSVSYVVFMYAASYIFQFCTWHKIVIVYNLITLIINIIVNNLTVERTGEFIILFIHYTIAIIFVALAYYLFKSSKNNGTPHGSS